mgnify:CR=1 FL=1
MDLDLFALQAEAAQHNEEEYEQIEDISDATEEKDSFGFT